jgi:hypothetical protein
VGHCTEYNKQTNTFCIVCKRWLFDPQLAANQAKNENGNDPELIKISFQDGATCDDGEANTICAMFSAGIRLTRLHWNLMEPLKEAGTAMKVMKGAP